MNFFFSEGLVRSGFLLCACILFFHSCVGNSEPEKNEVIRTEYPKLAEAITERDFDALWTFTSHENSLVQSLAWKAIAKSEANDLDQFIKYSIRNNNPLAWYALSLHPLTREQVDSLGLHYSDGRVQSEWVCEVFFRKGTLNTLNILLDKPQQLLQSEICSRAVGGILSRIEVDDITRRTVFDLAFNTSDEIIRRNLLYGFYRSAINRPASQSILLENFETFLEFRGDSFSVMMDEYIVRIAGKVGFMDVMNRRSDRELYQAVQLSNELARNVIMFDSGEMNHLFIKRLLRHEVDNVVAQTLQSFQEFETVPDELLEMIEFEIASVTRDPEVFAEALTVLVQNEREIGGYRIKLQFMDAQNEYLKHRLLPLFGEIESEEEYLNRIQNEISEGGIGGLRAVQALMNYYSENFENDPDLKEKVTSIARIALNEGDRSAISVLNMFLASPVFFSEDDYDWIHSRYETFVNTSQWEKAKVLEEVLVNRFPDRFEPLEIPSTLFRIPNWDRLYEMGVRPYWVLETDKGTVEIQLDPLAAPFTVSSVDSLARSGAYDDVPFHRVVRNFVAQGGDIDRKDGFGGPDYKLPTEPSLKSFERGMIGIASSGTDTEGSQFFVMLGWSLHLDGNYTIFGKVTKGMDVVDRIQIGDRVIEAKIHTR